MKLRPFAATVLFLAAACVCGVARPAPQAAADNKTLVTAFFRMMFQDKNVDKAMQTYVDKGLIQHDPYLPDGAAAMADFYGPYLEQHPQANAEIRHVIAEGDMVVVHSLWKESPEDTGQAVIDIFRVQNGKIVEHWDVSQDIPENPANRNTMF
ncbi:nuclear transport factor 2 family protein [Bordetella genomosp. 9]|uniref:Polyketide cyclase n=1 Tax=Bordetella genomosp. 9 TaxID=1416803 RepID=A0A1W6YUP5_9BORD|nr:nuclear transport factor 2 family protein [Bordetella genomosp. 9]ARP84807.1 polyketide cyclase [Bordetella genomosp. 9]ARP88897.1 polyketide cyclase [Bordetella genomosp. 9]